MLTHPIYFPVEPSAGIFNCILAHLSPFPVGDFLFISCEYRKDRLLVNPQKIEKRAILGFLYLFAPKFNFQNLIFRKYNVYLQGYRNKPCIICIVWITSIISIRIEERTTALSFLIRIIV